MDIQQGTDGGLRELHLFAGAGGGILAGQQLGHRCVCAVEWEPYAQAVLVARQNDGTFPPFPIWDDVQNFDGRPWRGLVDVVAGGFPCQDISVAGSGAGLDGERSGMWHHMARIIGEVRPRYAFIENSPALVTRGLDRVLCDLAALGFDARWGVISAADCGAPHKRERIWIMANSLRTGRRSSRGIQVQNEAGRISCEGPHARSSGASEVAAPMAHSNGMRQPQPQGSKQNKRGWSGNCREDVADTNSSHGEGNQRAERGATERAKPFQPGRWPTEPAVGRVVNGMAYRSHRLKAIGNGQVSRVAATAFHILSGGI